METLTVQAPTGDTLTDEAFDLVVGDLEQGLPEQAQASVWPTCVRIYCSPDF
ncbi:hypothetical protein [Kitasatospora sp. NPDC004531]